MPNLPTEIMLNKLNDNAKAAFTAYILSIFETRYLSQPLIDILKESKEILSFIAKVSSFSQGQVDEPSDKLIDRIKNQLEIERNNKNTKANWDTINDQRGGINTAHYFYDIPIQILLACLEALRLNPFHSMNSLVKAFDADTLYSQNGDPGICSRDMVEMRDTIHREVIRAYLYVDNYCMSHLFDVNRSFSKDFMNEIGKCSYYPSLTEYELEVKASTPSLESSTPDHPIKDTKSDFKTEPQNSFKYQVFISFKNLDKQGVRTPESYLAEDLFKFLSANGLSVFYSNISLEKLGISGYQKAIDDALDSAQILVCVGSSNDNLDSKWVRYEWSSFLNDILSNIKPNGRIFTYITGTNTTAIPRALRQGQVFHHERNEKSNMLNFIKNAIV